MILGCPKAFPIAVYQFYSQLPIVQRIDNRELAFREKIPTQMESNLGGSIVLEAKPTAALATRAISNRRQSYSHKVP